jgi:hypothetical protein
MIFQLIATVVLAGIAVYAYAQNRTSPKLALAVITLLVAGEVMVLAPNTATLLANRLGIGRGADLVFYLWILLSLVIALNLHLKLRASHEQMAALVRALALREAAQNPPDSEAAHR